MSTATTTSRSRLLVPHSSVQRPVRSRTVRRRAAGIAAALSLSVAVGIATSSALLAGATGHAVAGNPAWDSADRDVLADPAWDGPVKSLR